MSGSVELVALRHPLKVERDRVELPYGLTVAEMIDLCQVDQVVVDHISVTIDGRPVPSEWWSSVRPREGRLVELRVVPQGGGGGGKSPLRTLLTIAVIAASMALGPALGSAIFGVSANTAVIGGITAGEIGKAIIGLAGLVIQNTIASPRPSQTAQLSSISGSSHVRDSPTLSIQGSRNQARPFSPVPVVLGRHRQAPPLGAQTYTEVVGDKQYLRMLLVWGVGPMAIDASSITIEETPITQFEGVQIEHREGYPDDPPHTLYPNSVIQNDQAVLLSFASGAHVRTSDANADELSVDITFPQGLTHYTLAGAPGQRSVDIEIHYRKVGTSTWLAPSFTARTVPPSWINGPRITFTHKKAATIIHGFRWKTPERGQYEIRVRRVSADAPAVTQTPIVDQAYWTAYRTITIGNPIVAPVPLATTAVVIQATDQLNRIVDQLKGITTSVGKDWDAATGSWIDNRPIQNPASLFRLVLQGNAISEPIPDERIDLAALEDWHEYCEEHGFRFNMVRDFVSSVWDTLLDICSAGRASPTQVDGKWSVIIDRRQDAYASYITPHNSYDFYIEKVFLDLPHAWRIPFPNENEGFRMDERRVYRSGYSAANATKFEQIGQPGVTDPDLIQKHGRFMIVAGEHRPERWVFRQDVEFLTYRRGDKIAITHDVLLVGLSSGRIAAVEVDTDNNVVGVTLNGGVDMEDGKSYGLAIRTVRNARITRQVVLEVGEGITEVRFVQPIAPIDGAPAVRRGDVFGFGLIGQETDDGLVVSIKPESELHAQVIAVPYRDEIYDVEGEEIPPFRTNLTPLATVPELKILSVVSDESVLARGAGDVLLSQIALAYEPLSDPRLEGATVDVQIRPTETREPFYAAQVNARQSGVILIGNVKDGEYWDIRARHRVPGRLPGPWTTVYNHRVVGKSTPPGGLSGLTLSAFGGQAYLRWDKPAFLDIAFGGTVAFRHSQEELDDAEWDRSYDIGDAANARDLKATLPLKPGTYLARVFDASGNPSTTISKVHTKQATVLKFASDGSIDEAPSFSGIHEDTVADSGVLKLGGAGMFDDIPDLDEVEDLDTYGGIITSGTYYFASGFDFGSVVKVRLTTRIAVEVASIFDQMDSWSDVDSREDWDGTVQAQGNVRVFVRYTDDDPAATDASWSEWQRLDSAEFEARGFEFKAELDVDDDAFNVLVSELGVDYVRELTTA